MWIIHPFTDGNGRTRRILNLRCLVERALLEGPVRSCSVIRMPTVKHHKIPAYR
jgi:Fic family protein